MPKILQRAVLLSLLAGVSGGCNNLGYILYTIIPGPRDKTVPAKFDKFPGQRVVIIIHTTPSNQHRVPL